MQTIRVFIAIKLPSDVQTYVGAVTADLAAQVDTGLVRWVTPDRLHLTLRFLGDTAVSQLPELCQMLDGVGAQQRPFQMNLTQLGAFPNQRRPRVIWLGLGGETAVLTSLKQQLDQALLPGGWAVEKRPFQPHLTIGRVKDRGAGQQVTVGQQIKWQARVGQLAIPVTAVYLIESQLRPDGPYYTTRHTAQLTT